ncbi:ubiquitin carboxyl-terminal hydrolase Usp2 isoform X3 [Lucilia sericata]|uniref:ubiquitin carboxyl-terminal hydrolase Usp2 isoform X3 n=1 Tax=Lucilia sericata TaxID=13632 RepID=UPI0018A8435D|nr:ubiquitin carboxyl-terminal hydrolase Usp2 isoform X3 [Lucilia sericata]
MPVSISPRRSSTSASGNIYGSSTSSSSTGVSGSSDSASRSSITDRTSSGYKSYLDRASSLSKLTSSSSSYSPSSYLGSSSYSSYSPRSYSNYRSTGSVLTGGSTGVGTYRSTFSSLGSTGGSSYDTTTLSRYGVNRRSKASDILNKDSKDKAVTKKPPSGSETGGGSSRDSKRLSGSCSSSSLARLVATSGLDLYEKYSPAHYKPNTQLDSGSRSSLNEAGTDLEERRATVGDITANITLDRPRTNRYSRIYSRNDSDETDNVAAASSSIRRSTSGTRSSISGRISAANSNSNLNTSDSTDDIPTATFTLRSTRLRKSKVNDEDKKPLQNGTSGTETRKKYNTDISPSPSFSSSTAATSTATSNGIDTVAYVKLNKLKISEPKPEIENNATLGVSSASSITKSGSSSKLKTSSSHETIVPDLEINSYSSKNKTDENNELEDTDTSKVRSSATLRSVLPPASPTSSRYYDRDSSRSALLTSSTSSHNNTDENKKSTASDEETEGLCGLRNIGNTCFMNSVIQCLSHTNELTKFLRNYNATKSPTSKDQQILYEFSKLIKEMWTNNVNSVTPMELKRSFSAKHRMYSDYNQQDAQEFLRFFLDSLHGALNSGTKGEHLKIDDNLSDNKKAELTWEWYGRHENSLIRDLFVGQLKSTLRCTTCGNSSVTFDPFWDLSVPLPSSSRCKLDACLDLFIREEVLDGDEMPTCSKCQTRRKCTKSFTIQRFPKYLVIHLKRFSETRWSKLSNIVEFPTGERELNMGPYGANANSNQYYSLYAISNHMGSTAGGHYVAICKHPVSKKWHEFNDNLVSDSLSEHHLVSSSAYILFYERA